MTRGRALTALALAAAGVAAWWHFARTGGAPANHPPAPGVLAFGDSLTRGHSVEPQEAWPALLSERWGFEVISRGRDGRTLEEATRELEREVLAADAGTVVIFLGGNDLGNGRSPSAAMEDLDRLVRRCVGDGRMVAVCDVSPLPVGMNSVWEKGFAEVAARHGAILVEGVIDGLLTGDGYTADDGIHLNAAGQRAVADRIAAALEPHLP